MKTLITVTTAILIGCGGGVYGTDAGPDVATSTSPDPEPQVKACNLPLKCESTFLLGIVYATDPCTGKYYGCSTCQWQAACAGKGYFCGCGECICVNGDDPTLFDDGGLPIPH